MASALTSQERTLIQEAVAAGRVQRIPRGQSAFAPCGQTAGRETRKRNRKDGVLAERRRHKIRDLACVMTAKEIAAELEIQVHTVRSDLAQMHISAKRDQLGPRRKRNV